jgi:hypothetical protein
MPLVNTLLNFDAMNASVQVGDIVYYSHSGINIGGFDNTAVANTKRLCQILSIVNNAPLPGWTITVQYDNAIVSPPALGDFISFAKDKRWNTSSLLGYYANVKFVNNSTDKVELFAVGSEISESSK